MAYLQEITSNQNNPQQLETLFQAARSRNEIQQFSTALNECFSGDPDNLLLQAWHYRLLSAPEELETLAGANPNWKLAIPLAFANGLLFWALSDPKLAFPGKIPVLALLAAPITALFVIWFLFLCSRRNYPRALKVSIGLAAVVAAAFLLNHFVVISNSQDYLVLLIPHLALLAWAGIGVALVWLAAGADNSFAFLVKSLEVCIVAGVYLIAGLVLGGITLGMFAALSISLPEVLIRMIAAGGAGLIPVIAVATIYNPLLEPKDQDFKQSMSKFIGTMMRLLLPLTLAVLAVYIFVIPFNFLQPFQNRDVLIIYNAMLFAIMGLIVGATPIDMRDLSPKLGSALRTGILAVAVLAALVSLYALSAVLYRTLTGAFTINRLTMIGWNIINITLLVMMIVRLLQNHPLPWNERIKTVYRLGAAFYVGWTLFVILVMPFLFR